MDKPHATRHAVLHAMTHCPPPPPHTHVHTLPHLWQLHLLHLCWKGTEINAFGHLTLLTVLTHGHCIEERIKLAVLLVQRRGCGNSVLVLWASGRVGVGTSVWACGRKEGRGERGAWIRSCARACVHPRACIIDGACKDLSVVALSSPQHGLLLMVGGPGDGELRRGLVREVVEVSLQGVS
jgi:hypothetical protein